MSQSLLHQLKYRNKPQIGQFLGNSFGKLLLKQPYAIDWDMIVPVPLHRQKLHRRGYNQSETFAKGIGEVLQIPVEKVLERSKWTDTQTNKTRLERIDNVSGVFEIQPNQPVYQRRILLVDDVLTTGATLAACANILWKNGAKTVDLATIAAGGGV
ncbi:ComF family protein [Algoriphagus sp.]|uniref:ComF family protein n=1 Tax=Algoriphagus sp. TaxID=1872435 RepID=UPI00345DB915